MWLGINRKNAPKLPTKKNALNGRQLIAGAAMRHASAQSGSHPSLGRQVESNWRRWRSNWVPVNWCWRTQSPPAHHQRAGVRVQQEDPPLGAEKYRVGCRQRQQQPGSSVSNQVVFVRIRGRGSPIRDAEFGVDVFDVAGDGVRAEDDKLGDLPIGSARRQVGQYLHFTGR